MITPEIKYKYKNDNTTLEINFNFPAGIGSFSDDEEEIIEDFPELVEICVKANLDINNAIQVTDDINNAIYESLGNYVEIDWRDDQTIEIHNVNNIPTLINELKDIANIFLQTESD